VSGASTLAYREGVPADLRATFAISAHAVHDTAVRLGVLRGPPPGDAQVEAEWHAQREVVEFLAGEPGGDYWVCEEGGRAVGYARACRLGGVEQLTELMVLPSHHRRGIGRALLERCWTPGPPAGESRVVLAAGAPADLTLYSDFGVLPVSGHWHLRVARAEFRARRREADLAVDVAPLEAGAAVARWGELEPGVVGAGRRSLHEFFARTRECVALRGPEGDVGGLCWVAPGGDVGPAVAASPAQLVPTVVGALDRLAARGATGELGLYCTTANGALIATLRGLGLYVHWPGWVMASAPLPALDRYLPMRPPHLL
jgi:GNAT superfamily N-acetyltransferase